jgi:hypothetical protein
MWSGRKTLGEIEGSISKLRQEEGQLDTALASAASQAEALTREKATAHRELARIKLDELESGRLVRNLDAAEQRSLRIIEGRRLRLDALHKQRETGIAEVEAANVERDRAAAAVEDAVEAVDLVRSKAETSVRETPAWKKAQEVLARTDAIAVEAEKKATQSENELTKKRKPFDDDPLFAYLWRQNFATDAYTASGLTRYIDGLVADFIGFREVRPSYHMLLEIPLRLREHAHRQRQSADDVKATVAALEREAMVALGIEAQERQLAEARYRLAAADATAEKKRSLLREIEAQQADLISGDGDKAYTEALQTIADADAQDSIRTLYEEARRTATESDDRLVQRIDLLDQKLAKVQDEIATLRKTAQSLAQRRVDVENVRDRFRSSGYDHPNATFGNENEIGKILAQVIEGVVRSGILWDLLRGAFGTRRSRGRPDFGAPTFPFPFPMPGGGDGARGGEWRQPDTRGGWSSPSPGPPRNDSDEFKTGGSF